MIQSGSSALLQGSEDHPTHLKFSAAWVPFSVFSAVLGAAICRSLERKSLIFLGLGFFFEPEGRGFESLPARQFSMLLFADSTSERSEPSSPSRRAIH